MNIMEWKIISLLSILQLGLYLCLRRINKRKNIKTVNKKRATPNQCVPNHVEVLNFTSKSSMCNSCFNKRHCGDNNCGFYAQNRIASILENAQSSIDLCMYIFTSQTLADAILKAFNKGVRVRVITDSESSFACGSQIGYLREHAVPIRMKRSENLMHHKFVVVDGYLIITGSCNWTSQTFLGNWDHMLIATVPMLVKKFALEFDEIFNDFSNVHKN